jgi:hypothetical protein
MATGCAPAKGFDWPMVISLGEESAELAQGEVHQVQS